MIYYPGMCSYGNYFAEPKKRPVNKGRSRGITKSPVRKRRKR